MTIKKCEFDCKSEFQDKEYGKNMRVMNPYTNGYRCTVCGKEKTSAPTKGKGK